jgi:hypothetical protein
LPWEGLEEVLVRRTLEHVGQSRNVDTDELRAALERSFAALTDYLFEPPGGPDGFFWTAPAVTEFDQKAPRWPLPPRVRWDMRDRSDLTQRLVGIGNTVIAWGLELDRVAQSWLFGGLHVGLLLRRPMVDEDLSRMDPRVLGSTDVDEPDPHDRAWTDLAEGEQWEALLRLTERDFLDLNRGEVLPQAGRDAPAQWSGELHHAVEEVFGRHEATQEEEQHVLRVTAVQPGRAVRLEADGRRVAEFVLPGLGKSGRSVLYGPLRELVLRLSTDLAAGVAQQDAGWVLYEVLDPTSRGKASDALRRRLQRLRALLRGQSAGWLELPDADRQGTRIRLESRFVGTGWRVEAGLPEAPS